MSQADLFHRMAPYANGSGATFSPDRVYRYRLWRVWGDAENRVAFVGINPSSADENDDDATIRKCIGFARRWGYGALDMINLFAFISTDQNGLPNGTVKDGPMNAVTRVEVAQGARRVVLAWGCGKSMRVRRYINTVSHEVTSALAAVAPDIGRLGVTDDGYPRHPLMLPYSTPFVKM